MSDQRKLIIYSLVVENKPGVLFRVASQFRRRHFNIESVSVGVTEREDTSRMTVTMYGDDQMAEDFARILRRTVDVIDVERLDVDSVVRRELALLRVKEPGVALARSIAGDAVQVLSASNGIAVLQLVGEPSLLSDAVRALHEGKVLEEVLRTGEVAVSKG